MATSKKTAPAVAGRKAPPPPIAKKTPPAGKPVAQTLAAAVAPAPAVMLGSVRRGPGRPSNAEIAARVAPPPAAPIANGKAPKAAPPAGPTAAENALAKAQAAADREAEALARAASRDEARKAAQADRMAAKMAATARTVDQILGVDVPKSDPRAAWHGVTLSLIAFKFVNDEAIPVPKMGTRETLFAVPTKNDVGGGGIDAALAGQLAAYHRWDAETETYLGQPFYLTIDEIQALRVEG